MHIFTLVACAFLCASPPAHAELVRLSTRPGVTLLVAIETPRAQAAARIVIFVGGDGALRLSDSGAPTSGQAPIIGRLLRFRPAG